MYKESVNYNDFEVFLTVRKSLAPNSVRHFLSRIKIFLKWLGTKELTNQNVEEFIFSLKEKGLKNNSINTYVNAINQYVAYLKHRGSDVDVNANSLKKNKTYIDVLTPKEMFSLMNTHLNYGTYHGKSCERLNETYSTFLYFLCVVGCRFSEAANLDSDHVKNGFVVFENTKNHEYRIVPILKHLELKLMIEAKRGYKTVFATMAGNKLIPQLFSADLKKRAKKIGLQKRVHPHLTRHSFSTDFYSKTKDLIALKEIGGWKSLDELQKYVHLSQAVLKDRISHITLNTWYLSEKELIDLDIDTIRELRCVKDERFESSININKDGFTISVKKKS